MQDLLPKNKEQVCEDCILDGRYGVSPQILRDHDITYVEHILHGGEAVAIAPMSAYSIVSPAFACFERVRFSTATWRVKAKEWNGICQHMSYDQWVSLPSALT